MAWMPSNQRRRKDGKLNPRHARVIDEYLVNGMNKNDAMRSQGYEIKKESGKMHCVFHRPDVTEEIDRRLKAMADKVDVSVGWVLERLKRQATAGERLARYRQVGDDGVLYWDFTGAPDEDLALIQDMATDIYVEGRGQDAREVKKFKITLPNSKDALDSLARYLGMFKDRIDVGVSDSLAELIAKGRARIKAKE